MGKRRDHIVRLEHRLKKRQRRVKSLAIAVDPNEVLKTRSVKGALRHEPEPEVKITESVRRTNLEKQADRPPAKRYRYGTEISKFCAYMIAKHKKDYKAMELDPKNVYQESAGSIKRMILKFDNFKVNKKAYELASEMAQQEVNQKKKKKIE